jgi:hypothetical protein
MVYCWNVSWKIKKKQPTEQPTGKKSIEKKRAVHE